MGDRMNCNSCHHKKSIPFFAYVKQEKQFVKNRYYCTHPDQTSMTPWIVRGQVVLRGNCDNVFEYGRCPFELVDYE